MGVSLSARYIESTDRHRNLTPRDRVRCLRIESREELGTASQSSALHLASSLVSPNEQPDGEYPRE
jgi:hypothetical protein